MQKCGRGCQNQLVTAGFSINCFQVCNCFLEEFKDDTIHWLDFKSSTEPSVMHAVADCKPDMAKLMFQTLLPAAKDKKRFKDLGSEILVKKHPCLGRHRRGVPFLRTNQRSKLCRLRGTEKEERQGGFAVDARS